MILHQRNKCYPNWTITDRVMTLCRFSKMAAIPLQIYLRFFYIFTVSFVLNFAANQCRKGPPARGLLEMCLQQKRQRHQWKHSSNDDDDDDDDWIPPGSK